MTTAEKLRQEGRLKGRQEGQQEDYNEALFNLIRNMKNNNLSDKEIAGLIIVAVPLHLLDEHNSRQ